MTGTWYVGIVHVHVYTCTWYVGIIYGGWVAMFITSRSLSHKQVLIGLRHR